MLGFFSDQSRYTTSQNSSRKAPQPLHVHEDKANSLGTEVWVHQPRTQAAAALHMQPLDSKHQASQDFSQLRVYLDEAEDIHFAGEALRSQLPQRRDAVQQPHLQQP